MEKILVTGGLGFIGSHFISSLVDKNYHITIIDNKDPKTYSSLIKSFIKCNNIKIININMNHPIEIDGSFDYIVHAAALLGVQKSIDYPYTVLNENAISTQRILDFAFKMKNLKKFIYFSTSEIYGDIEEVTEDMPAVIRTNGRRWSYATSKLFGEYLTLSAFHEHGLPSSIIRPFNVYGPYRYGTNALSTFINAALKNENITLSGDGQQKRSWCYIDDFIDCLNRVLLCDRSKGESFNIGNGEEYLSIYDLAKEIIILTESRSKIILNGQFIEDIRYRKPSTDKAKILLGYEPKISLQSGLEKTISWIKSENDVNAGK